MFGSWSAECSHQFMPNLQVYKYIQYEWQQVVDHEQQFRSLQVFSLWSVDAFLPLLSMNVGPIVLSLNFWKRRNNNHTVPMYKNWTKERWWIENGSIWLIDTDKEVQWYLILAFLIIWARKNYSGYISAQSWQWITCINWAACRNVSSHSCNFSWISSTLM
jgi:hypothetical protein